MIKQFRHLLLGLLTVAGAAQANNLGNVTSLRIFTGVDTKQYIEIGHSGTDLQTIAGTDFTSAGTYEANPILIPWPTDEATSMSIWSTLQKSLSCQCIQFYGIKGFVPASGTVSKTPPIIVVATEYRFISQ
jgi:hypothetical protein